MKNSSVLFIIVLLGCAMFSPLVSQIAQRVFSSSEAPPVEWSKRYTGAVLWGGFESYVVVQTDDGGYAVGGTTASLGAQSLSLWLTKTDSNGNVEWNKTYGESGNRNWIYSMIETGDGGYVLVGATEIPGVSLHAYMVKTDAYGSVQWSKIYEGRDAFAVAQAQDGGYVVAGDKWEWDGWLMKTDANGTEQWSRTFAEVNNTELISVVRTNDGGYVAAGATQYPPYSGKVDAYLVKTDSSGNTSWSQEFSRTTGDDYGYSVIQTSDGGYAIAGETDHFGNADFWLIKTNAVGSLLWDKTYGGAQWDGARSIVQTADGGYMLAGQTYSFGAGGSDYWLVNTDMNGNMEWNQTFGGVGDDRAYSVIRTLDGGYALVGCTNSFTGYTNYEVWLIKLASSTHAPRTWIVAPDGSGDFLTIQTAIDAASDGDTIFVRNGTYSGTIAMDKSLTLEGENKYGTIIDGGDGILVLADNVRISNFTIQHAFQGPHQSVFIDGYVNMSFFDNIMLDNFQGIRLIRTSGDLISNNIINGNTAGGIGFDYVNNTIIRNNTITNSGYLGAIHSGYPNYNITFLENNIAGNSIGIEMNNVFNGSRFYHNNLINNSEQVRLEYIFQGVNNWDNGYPSGGNYWSDYSGTDANADGIGDTPYVINQQNIDNYPLMRIFPTPSQSMAPIADFTQSPLDPIASEIITLNASISKNGWNGTSSVPIATYSWDFGDSSTSNGQVVTHAYATSGNFTVKLNVTDVQGLWNTTEKQVQVGQPRTPFASFVMNPETTHVNEGVELNASGSISGWNGTHENPIVSYTWDFGDGNMTSSAEPVMNHSYAEAGVFNVTLTVSDSGNMNSSFSRVVLVIMPTYVSISTSSTSTVVGFTVNIYGTLQDIYGNGLQNEPVVIYYTFAGVNQWFPLTSSITDSLGQYSAQWIPTVTGAFTLKADWAGNVTYSEAYGNVTLSSVPFMNQYVFSVESNSTISSLAFNTTSSELSFTASGPSGTTGYVKMTVAKSLVADATSIKVYLDNNQTSYSIESAGDSWILTFNYTHSSHRVTVDLGTIVVPEFPSLIILSMLLLLSVLAVTITLRKPFRKTEHGNAHNFL